MNARGWRSMSRAEISANPLRYWRMKFLEERRAWPAHTKLEFTEYGFLRKCRARRTLARLVQAEQAVRA